MSNIINVSYEKPIEKLFEKLTALMKNEDGKLIGDKNKGNFHIKSKIGVFSGNYNIQNTLINIVIEKKPFFISTKLIEMEVKKYLQAN